jgi:hypothetical protein
MSKKAHIGAVLAGIWGQAGREILDFERIEARLPRK